MPLLQISDETTNDLDTADNETDLEYALVALLEETSDAFVQSFENAGVLTYNRGFEMRTASGEFQVTIVQKR